MNKTKFNLFGNNFTYTGGGNKGYSSHGKESKHIEWVFDGGGKANFYIDDNIGFAFDHKTDLSKYAWVSETKTFPNQKRLVSDIKNNIEKYLDTFDTIFTYERELIDINPERIKFLRGGYVIKNPKIYKKTKMISMISSNKNFCSGHSKRLEWVDRIGDKVDLYGRGFNEIEYKEEGLCDYMFSVAIENCEDPGGFTEKILDCFATGTIPVYLGCPDIGDYFNMDGIILLSDEFDVSEEIYYSKMDAIKDNFERSKKWELMEDYLWINYLKQKYE